MLASRCSVKFKEVTYLRGLILVSLARQLTNQ